MQPDFRINGGISGGLKSANYNERVGEGVLGLMISGTFRIEFEGMCPDLKYRTQRRRLNEARCIDRAVIGQYEVGNSNYLYQFKAYSLGKFSANLRENYLGEITR
jgi:iron complex outermembrane receptor protein